MAAEACPDRVALTYSGQALHLLRAFTTQPSERQPYSLAQTSVQWRLLGRLKPCDSHRLDGRGNGR